MDLIFFGCLISIHNYTFNSGVCLVIGLTKLTNNQREIGPTISNCAGSATIIFSPTVLRYAMKYEPSIPINVDFRITPYIDIIRTMEGTIQKAIANMMLICFDLLYGSNSASLRALGSTKDSTTKATINVMTN